VESLAAFGCSNTFSTNKQNKEKRNFCREEINFVIQPNEDGGGGEEKEEAKTFSAYINLLKLFYPRRKRHEERTRKRKQQQEYFEFADICF
jgi:hypothetical protein